VKLYEIADALEHILTTWEDVPDNEMASAALDELTGDLATKAESICKVIRTLEAHAEAKQAEAERLSAAAKRDKAKAEWLEGYLLAAMQRLNTPRIDTPLFRVSVVRNSQPKVTATVPLDTLPPLFVTHETKEVWGLDRPAILAWLAQGKDVGPGVVVEHGQHLRIG
jgi:hypothetical protein